MNDLFDHADEAMGERPQDLPLAVRSSPQDLEAFVGQEQIVGAEGTVRKLIEEDKIVSCIFYGPPGSGKTALARIIARASRSDFIRLNAVTAKIEDLRSALMNAARRRKQGMRAILFIDEIHRFNKMQQEGLLPALEEGTVTLIGTTTKNPFFSLIPPLRSRVLLFEFEKLTPGELADILNRAVERERFEVTDPAARLLVQIADGDARRLLNILEAAVITAGPRPVSPELVRRVIEKQPLSYDRDENYHYDVISAFIKSIRGSDPDAALYWLALMLEGGEDPLYIARRLIILASEDIGLADPLSLPIAESAYEAVDRIGMPEARITLSHVTIYLTLQPKSNSSYRAISNATEYVKANRQVEVPSYLRSSHPDGSRYKYPHDYPYHYVDQEYLGREVRFYQPEESPLGQERELKRRLDFLRKLRSSERPPEEKAIE
jgi:putative ATPase